MSDALTMGGGERVGDLSGEPEGFSDREPTALVLPQAIGQRLSLDELHDEERRAVLLANVVERADVRVRQL